MNSRFEKLKKTARKFPDSPGVYFFLDKNRKPIYIGRAGSLKKRVSSYFRAKDPRIIEMVDSAYFLINKKSGTLLEAVIAEANQIKKHWPKYNVKDKDNRSFAYLVFLGGEYPKPVIVRGRELENYSSGKFKIFGPYLSYYLIRTALELARKIFPYSTCKFTGKPCFHYQIGLCPGVCIGAVSPADYKKNIDNLILFFGGRKKALIKKLKKENPEKLKALEHVEDAALLGGMEIIASGQSRIFSRIEAYDISHLSGKEPVGAMAVFEDGLKNSDQYRLFKIRGIGGEKNYDDAMMLAEVLDRRLKHREWNFPSVIFVDGGLAQVRAARKVLEINRLSIPVVGLVKTLGHSASAESGDRLIVAGAKTNIRELIVASKRLFQQARNEAHRFAIGFSRRRRGL